MRKILFTLLLLSFKVNSQDLTGIWKVISYEDSIVYYNKTKDSISYKDSSRKKEAENFRKMSELIIFPITYNFDNSGRVIINHAEMGLINSGKFEIDMSNKKIIMFDEKGKKDELPYIYTNGIIFIEMKMDIGYIKIGLKKK